jgi:RNA ligase (TIGR02306 family)
MPITRELEIEFSHTFFNFEGARPLQEGDDLAQMLGVTKYVPEIPESMQGDVFFAGTEVALHFDIEDCKAYPQALLEGEEVTFTEKLHGTCTVVVVLPRKDAKSEAFGRHRNVLVSSKGLAADGLFFQDTPKNRQSNLYVRAVQELVERIDAMDDFSPEAPLYLLGETFGSEVQDLHYGTPLAFRLFTAACGYHGAQAYQNFDHVYEVLASQFGVDTVPVLYRGPYSEARKAEYTDGPTLVGGGNIREGIVMTPVIERRIPTLGRVSLKSVSARYLRRKGGTEFN